MQLWLRRLTTGRDRSTPGHIMLGDEDPLDKDLERAGCGLQSNQRANSRTDVSSDRHQAAINKRHHRQSRSRPSAATAFLSDDSAGECRIGNTVLSSYCCVVLLIFSFLFILIGSMLTHMYYFAKQRDDNVQVSQFLHKHSYLKEVSPFVICLGVVMLVSGVSFLIIRRCRRPSPGRYVESLHNDAYFPPEDDDHRLAHCRRGSNHLISGVGIGGSVGGGIVGRDSITSPVSSHAVSPLLAPSSASTNAAADWKWPANVTTTTTPLGGGITLPLGSSASPVPSLSHRHNSNGSPTPLDPQEPDNIKGLSLTVPVSFDPNVVPSVLTIPVSSSPTDLASHVHVVNT